MADYRQSDLESDLQRTLEVSGNFSRRICETFLRLLREAILRDERVHLTRIGMLEARHVARHETRRPPGRREQKAERPDGTVTVPAYRRLTWKTSEAIRDQLKLPRGGQNAQG